MDGDIAAFESLSVALSRASTAQAAKEAEGAMLSLRSSPHFPSLAAAAVSRSGEPLAVFHAAVGLREAVATGNAVEAWGTDQGSVDIPNSGGFFFCFVYIYVCVV